MEKKLIEVAKEFNVGKDSVVEFLHSKGFDIDNRPIARLSSDMYEAVSKRFQDSLAEKKKADKIEIGIRPGSGNTPATVTEPVAKKEVVTVSAPSQPTIVLAPKSDKVETPTPPVREEKPANTGGGAKFDLKPKTLARPEKKEEPKVVKPVEKPAETPAPPPVEAEKKPVAETPKPPVAEPTPVEKPVVEKTDKGEKTERPTNPDAIEIFRHKPRVLGTIDLDAIRKQEEIDKSAKKRLEREASRDYVKERQKAKKQQDDKAKERETTRRDDQNKDRQGQKPSRDNAPANRDHNRDNNRDNNRRDDRRDNNRRDDRDRNQNRNTPTPPAPQVSKEEKAEKDGNVLQNNYVATETIRAESPTLGGLKVLGTIDLNQFDKPKTRREREKERKERNAERANAPKKDPNAPATTTTTTESESEATRRRKRKRKKVASSSDPNPAAGGAPKQGGTGATDRPQGGGGGGNRGGQQGGGGGGFNRGGQQGGGGGFNRGGGNNNPPNTGEVSKRDIEEKLKATMNRLGMGGGGGRSRQKVRRDKRDKMREKEELRQAEMDNAKLQLTEFITVAELASVLNVSVAQVISSCMSLGYFVSINQRLDAEVIGIVAEEFGHEVEFISADAENEEQEADEPDAPEDLVWRAPIVTVMGHVDHGKTSLLDYIRKANVVSGEAGGITQHIGAYEVINTDGKKITFLDTPGHEAFTAMRARGAKVTDVAVIIIAADDSIMPQTREAISHAQAAGVPIVFAINKIDKDGASPDKIKQELSGMDLLVEEWGGKYQSQDIAAKKGLNVDLLLEKILLEAEILDLKANPNKRAVGTVVEASLDKGRGYVTKVLVQSGTLKIGDPIIAGEHSGKVRAMFNERGQKVLKAGPSTPVLILGLGGAPQAGEKFRAAESESEAKQIANRRAQIVREQSLRATKRISLEEIGRRLALGNFKELNVIIKGDVDGSVEALADSLIKQSHETVAVRVIHKAVGAISDSDIMLASASDAIIVGFQVRPTTTARKLAEREGVEIKHYSIIYEAINEIRAAIEGMLEPTKEEKITGQVEVRAIYKTAKFGTIAGCYVQEGSISRNSFIRVIRDGIVVFPVKEGAKGSLGSLKRFQDDAKEVKRGFECGLTIDGFQDVRENDTVEVYEIIEVKQKLK